MKNVEKIKRMYVALWAEMHAEHRRKWEECVRFVLPASVQEKCLASTSVEVSHEEVCEEWNKRGLKPSLVAREVHESFKGIPFSRAHLWVAVRTVEGDEVVPFTERYWKVNIEGGDLWL